MEALIAAKQPTIICLGPSSARFSRALHAPPPVALCKPIRLLQRRALGRDPCVCAATAAPRAAQRIKGKACCAMSRGAVWFAARTCPGLPEKEMTIAALAPHTDLLRVAGVSVRFGGITALDQVSFSVAAGQIVGLIGPNGAGKTTLFNCLSRLYTLSEGDILFEGQPILGHAAARHRLAGHRPHLPEPGLVPDHDGAPEHHAGRPLPHRQRLLRQRPAPAAGAARGAGPGRPCRPADCPAGHARAWPRPA